VSGLDPKVLSAALERLDRGDAPPPAEGLEAALQHVVDLVAEVFTVTGAGLMFLDDARALRYLVSSDEAGRVLESAQEELGYGPCVDALVHERHVITDDLATDDRWPRLRELVEPERIHAVLGVPVHLAGGAIGSLNVYYDRPHAWAEMEVAALGAFTGIIERLVESAVLAHQQSAVVTQLQHALDHRVVIDRAIGVLMAREGLDAVGAFDRLRRDARVARRKVADLAEEVLTETRRAPAGRSTGA
jgi:GAF domain-containing protein